MNKFFVIAVFLFLPAAVVAQNPQDYKFVINNRQATITQYTGAGGPVTVPARLGGWPVTAIGDYAFYGCKITQVGIPDGVTVIGFRAFQECRKLWRVRLPFTLITIGDWAFSDCASLWDINMPWSLIYINRYAFDSCTSLTMISIPKSVKSIGTYGFTRCKNLATVQIHRSTHIDRWTTFKQCPNLTIFWYP